MECPAEGCLACVAALVGRYSRTADFGRREAVASITELEALAACTMPCKERAGRLRCAYDAFESNCAAIAPGALAPSLALGAIEWRVLA